MPIMEPMQGIGRACTVSAQPTNGIARVPMMAPSEQRGNVSCNGVFGPRGTTIISARPSAAFCAPIKLSSVRTPLSSSTGVAISSHACDHSPHLLHRPKVPPFFGRHRDNLEAEPAGLGGTSGVGYVPDSSMAALNDANQAIDDASPGMERYTNSRSTRLINTTGACGSNA